LLIYFIRSYNLRPDIKARVGVSEIYFKKAIKKDSRIFIHFVDSYIYLSLWDIKKEHERINNLKKLCNLS